MTDKAEGILHRAPRREMLQLIGALRLVVFCLPGDGTLKTAAGRQYRAFIGHESPQFRLCWRLAPPREPGFLGKRAFLVGEKVKTHAAISAI